MFFDDATWDKECCSQILYQTVDLALNIQEGICFGSTSLWIELPKGIQVFRFKLKASALI